MKLGSDRVALDAAVLCAERQVGTPVHADLARQGLADLLAHRDISTLKA